jgi:hypothetical protein
MGAAQRHVQSNDPVGSEMGSLRGYDILGVPPKNTIKYIMPPMVRTGDAIRQQLDTKSVLLSQLSIHVSDKE